MKQPPGFIVKGKERLVCRLRRSIYGLKQSARCWNQRLHAVLQQLGFKQSESDHCLYTKVVGGLQVFLLVYVDDILVACRSSAEIDKITRALKREFDITDLGEPSYFLGLEIQRHDGKYSVSLEGYIDRIAQRYGLQAAKAAKSPMDIGFVSTTDSSTPFSDNLAYRSLVGALLYVAVCARPDVAVSASILGRRYVHPQKMIGTRLKGSSVSCTQPRAHVWSTTTKPILPGSRMPTGQVTSTLVVQLLGLSFYTPEEQFLGAAGFNIVLRSVQWNPNT